MSALDQLAETSKNHLHRRGRPHMGTTTSPWHYDAGADRALWLPSLRESTISCCDLSQEIPSGLASFADTPQAFDPMLLVSGNLASKRFRMTETQMRNRCE